MAESNKNYDRFWKNRSGIVSIANAGSAPNISVPYAGIVATGPSAVTDVSANPMSSFTLQVTGVGGVATLWSVTIEGSLDGTTFSEIITHTSQLGDGENLYSGTTLFPVNYFRINVTALTLGPATSISANVLGTQ